jgi:pimeloyl-ACP methyl ester carboxylesterase
MALLHGLAETSAFFWRPLIKEFEGRYRIVAVDLLGHGESSKPFWGYGPGNQGRLTAELIKRLGLSPAVVVGHSLGGIIGARLAIDWPQHVAKMALVDTPIPKGPIGNFGLAPQMRLIALLGIAPLALPGAGLLADLARRLTPPTLEKAVMSAVLRTWKVPYDPAKLTDEFLNQSISNSYFALEQDLRFVFLFHHLESRLHKLTAPALIVLGDDDVVLSSKRANKLKQLIPNAQLEVIPDAGHLSFIDQPELFVQKLAAFLAAG